MQKKLHIKKGDQVIAISGNEKGKSGTVLEVDRQKCERLLRDSTLCLFIQSQTLRTQMVVS